MGFYILKIIISAVIIVAISEIAKRNSLMGAIIASVPIISLMAMIWLYFETNNVVVVAKLSRDIFWMVIPSLLFFIVLPLFLKLKINFFLSVILSLTIMGLGYFLLITTLKQVGMRI